MRATEGSTALLTDRYELTTLDAALHDGAAARRSVFEVFARRLPEGRRYGVLAGNGRLIEAIERFRFDDATLAALDDDDVVSPSTLRWLADYRFRGQVTGYREGEIYLPDSPVLTVTGSFADTVLLETLVLSVINHDSAIASAAARMVVAAGERPLLEFGGRRTHEQAAIDAARAAYLVGFAGTSNLAAGARYAIPSLGTSAHAFTLLHDDEVSAFEGQVAALGKATTLLVDTYDTAEGVQRAIAAGGPGLGGIRIDSGDLHEAAVRSRASLDAAGATDTRIVASGDLDEYRLEELRDAPIDSYGVGTSVVTGSGSPTAGFVYKLVARARGPNEPLEPVAKAGGSKATIGGEKAAARVLVDGTATAEHLRAMGTPTPEGARELQVPLMRDGEPQGIADLTEAREHHRAARAELPAHALRLDPGEPCIPTRSDLDRGPTGNRQQEVSR